jgi:hypothetical protein
MPVAVLSDGHHGASAVRWWPPPTVSVEAAVGARQPTARTVEIDCTRLAAIVRECERDKGPGPQPGAAQPGANSRRQHSVVGLVAGLGQLNKALPAATLIGIPQARRRPQAMKYSSSRWYP